VPDRFFGREVRYTRAGALDLLAALQGAREHLEREEVWTPLVVEIGSEEGRLLDLLEP
jgi:hypothetical protein